MIVFTLVPQSLFPKAEISYTFLSIYSESQSHLTMYLARAYTRATLPDLHHCRPLPGRVRFKGSPQNPLPRGVLDEDKEGVGRVARITVGQVNAAIRAVFESGGEQEVRELEGPSKQEVERRLRGMGAYLEYQHVRCARGGSRRTSECCHSLQEPSRVGEAPISPTRPARIWNNLGILIADAGIGGFVIDNHP